MTARMRDILRKLAAGWLLDDRGKDAGELFDGTKGGRRENVSTRMMNQLVLDGMIRRSDFTYSITDEGREELKPVPYPPGFRLVGRRLRRTGVTRPRTP